ASSLLALAGGDPERITGALVFEAAAAKDPLAQGLVDGACRALGACIGGIVNALDPELIVVTGGVAASLARFEPQIRAAVSVHALAHPLARTRIRFVPTDKRQTVRGGAALVLYELGRRGERPATVSRT
ncbi:MAG: ROK family protein, partial [Gemmatimonadota bacterium]